MLLHIDGSRHQWLQNERWRDLIVILDDATSEIYYAQLVEEESTATGMAAVRQVIERKGLFCALYSDRGSHFWLTPKAGGNVDLHRLTQFGRALRDVGIQPIPAYSPQARGRSERCLGTWQGRLPQELRLRQIHTVEEADHFLCQHYVAEFNLPPCSPDLNPIEKGWSKLKPLLGASKARSVKALDGAIENLLPETTCENAQAWFRLRFGKPQQL